MKKLTAILLAALLVFTLAACSGDGGSGDQNQTPSGGDTQQSGGDQQAAPEKDTLYVAINADVQNLDPYLTSSATDNLVNYEMYDGLVKMSPQNEAKPWIATEWDISDDGLTYTFKLRDDVVFHNGEKLTSDDVVFSAERAFQSAYMASTFALYCESANAPDDYTVELHLRQPYAPFISLLDTAFVIHSRKAWEDAGSDEAFLEHPIGTGPYQFVEHKLGESVTLKANPDHFAIVPAVPNVVYKVITDPSTISVALETGEIDLAGYGSAVPATNLALLEQNESLNIQYKDSVTTAYITMNTEVAPFDNKLVRQAVSYAVDKQFLIDVAEDGHGTVATAMTNSLIFGHPEKLKGQPFDMEKAKSLLAEAGYPDGAGLGRHELKVMEGKSQAAAQAVQNNLVQLGMDVGIQVMEKNAYLADVLSGGYTIAYLSITLGSDAAMYSQIFTTPNINGLNSARVSDAEIDQLFADAETTTDTAARIAGYEKVFERLEDECYYAPLYYPQNAYITNKRIVLGDLYPSGLYVYQITLTK